jgi:spore coat polysaccharide biosynthesis protein SpsF (cytidylyltransferase family)
MRIVGIIQARSSSVRCPGKMLRPLHGRPMIDWVMDAARRAAAAGALNAVAVATSDDASDDALAAHVAALGVPVHRGPLDDVARRMLEAAIVLKCDAFVRINGDSPLLDSGLIKRAVELYRNNGHDLVTNVAVRSFPKGQSVEVISRAAMQKAVAQMASADEREHVTQYFYRNSDRFRIKSFRADEPMPHLQMSVDTSEDFARCEAVIAACSGDVGGKDWRRLADLYLAEEAT